MFNRNLVTSNFDCETLISEKYLRYLLLAQIDAGLMELVFDFVDPQTGIPTTVTLHPPADEDYQRLYPPSPDAQLPTPVAGSFDMQLLPGEAHAFNDVAFAPDGRRLFTRSVDSIIRIWDLDERTQNDAAAFQVDPGLGSAFNAAGTQVAITAANNNNHRISIWDLASKASIKTLTGHSHVVECVAFSPDGQRLVSGSFDSTVRVWDLTSIGDPLVHTLMGHTGRVMAVAFNHAGTQIVSGGEDGTVRVWDAQSGTPLQVLSGHTGPVNCVAWSPNDLRIATGSNDTTMRLWDPVAGTNVRRYTEHQAAVLSVDIGVNGTRILTGSADNALKLWTTSGATSIRTIRDYFSDVTRVRFSGGPNGHNASVSAGGSIRIWGNIFASPVKTIELRMDFMHINVFTTIVQHLPPPDGDRTFEVNIGLIVYLALYADLTPNDLEMNHQLRLSFGRFDPATRFLLEQASVDVPFVEDQIRSRLDRNLPLGVAQGQQVQQIRMQKLFPSDGRRTLGLYVDLALREKPGNEFLPPRGILALAQDFRAPASAIAFATSPGLFALLGPDAKAQRAERKPGSSGFSFPLRKDLSDPDSDVIGSIDSVSVGPELTSSPQVPTGRLMANVDATYEESTPDVGVAIQFFFRPKRNPDGIVEWESDVDVDLGLLATLLFVVGGLVLLFPFIGPFSITAGLLVTSFAALLGQKIAEHYAAKAIAEKTDEQELASVLDALPVRLPAASRRWDPFYVTNHQIVAKLDEAMVIDKKGIAFSSDDVVLDKQPTARADIAPVGEERDGGAISAVRFDVPDFRSFANDFRPEVTAPGVDRLAFVRTDEVNEPTVVTLTIDQILERKELKRVLAPIVLDAHRIYLVSGQIDQLLSATWRMRTLERDRLIREFQDRERDEINTNELAQIEQDVTDDLGGSATPEEIAEEVERRIEKLIDERRKEYIADTLMDDLHEALAPFLRFDVAPEELVDLQHRGIFSLDGKEIIVRHNKNGTVTPYYRDHPDADPRDNLLSLPHYTFPYVPPPPP